MKNLFLFLLICLASTVNAQTTKIRNQTVFDLQTKYDLWPSDGKLLVQDVFTLTVAKAKYPACFAAWEREKKATGLTVAQADTWIMGMTLAEAAYFDALWTNADWSANSGNGRGLCLSRNTILFPVGTYYTRDQLDYGYNVIRGTNNSSNDEPSGKGGTVIKLWNEKWRGDPKNRVLFGAFHGGTDGSNSYSEGVQFSDLRIDGGAGQWADPNYTITGLQAWDFGSGSEVHNLFISHCDVGIEVVRGTPFTATGANSIFECNTAAIALTGGAGATVTFSGTLESDDCPTLFLVRPGYARASGALLKVDAVKVEWAVTSARTWKPEAIVTGEGWMDLNFGSIHYATGNVHLDALFNLRGNVNTSFLHVGDLQVFAGSNVQALVHDDIAKQTWMYDVGWTSKIKMFDWYCDGQASQLVSWPAQAISVTAPHQGRLGYLMGDPVTAKPVGAFDRAKGAPKWSDVTGNSKPVVVRNLGGFNCANVEKFFAATGLQAAIDALHPTLMRFPGGTVANKYHPDESLSGYVALAKASKVPVLWVANLYDGTTAEMLTAIKAFRDQGIEVVGVEMGNEYYLKKYADVFPNATSYLTTARTFIAVLHQIYPDMPAGIVVAPSAAMKDADSKSTSATVLAKWNTDILSTTTGDAYILHAYGDPTDATYMPDFTACVATLSAKPVWVTEYNCTPDAKYFQTVAQSTFIQGLRATMTGIPNVQFACLHNLTGAGAQSNAIQIKSNKAALTVMGTSISKQ